MDAIERLNRLIAAGKAASAAQDHLALLVGEVQNVIDNLDPDPDLADLVERMRGELEAVRLFLKSLTWYVVFAQQVTLASPSDAEEADNG